MAARDAMASIFISYRREDASGHAGRLCDRLGGLFDATTRRRGDAAEGGETTADNPANRGGEQIDGQQRCDAPCDQPVQHAVEAYLNSRQPGGNVTSQPESDAAADDPPHSGADT